MSTPSSQLPKFATNETTEKFNLKMHEMAIKAKESEVAAIAKSSGFLYANLAQFPISAEALKLIPKNTSKKNNIICFLYIADEVRLGTTDANNPALPQTIELIKQNKPFANINVYLISPNSLEHAFKLYDAVPDAPSINSDLIITEKDIANSNTDVSSLEKLGETFSKTPLSEILTIVISSAIKMNVSDVHIEAEEKGVAVRFRLDGLLQTISILPADSWHKIITRIKLLAGLKINVSDIPQDGRFSIQLTNNHVDVRVSALPTKYGESVVMRLLSAATVQYVFEELGLSKANFKILKQEINRPNGMIVTTGPTGSGKTTTLYAILNKLNQTDVKIITIEDPIEYQLEGINQSQVDHTHFGGELSAEGAETHAGKEKYSFAQGLRSIMRQDPDIIMVGEIRDLETADTAIQAALTGHLVVSTLHTNSAAGAIARFMSMGTKPFLLAPAINAVIGQRLVRRLCTKCKKEAALDAEKLDKVKNILNALLNSPESKKNVDQEIDLKNLKFFEAVGCPDCHNLGYKGRVGIFEIFAVTPTIEKGIIDNKVSETEIQSQAVSEGMVTMAQDGLLKALQGLTSVDEVFRMAE